MDQDMSKHKDFADEKLQNVSHDEICLSEDRKYLGD